MIKPPFSRLQVVGNSMLPNLVPGQFLVSFNWAYFFGLPKIGDLIVVKNKEIKIVKRVQKVLNNDFFVIGDNQKESTDSRHFGWLKKDQIVGKVVYKFDDRGSKMEDRS